jgi:hypothetical protein
VFDVGFPFPKKSRQVTGDFKRIAMFTDAPVRSVVSG